MKILDETGVRQWLADRSLPYDEYSRSVRPKWRDDRGVDIELPADGPAEDLRGLLGLFRVVPRSDEPSRYNDSLVVFDDWDINDDPLFLEMIRLFRRAVSPNPMALLGAYAQSFSADEGWERASYFLVALLAGWDAYFIPDHGDFFLFSHSRELHIITDSEATMGEQLRCLRSEGARVRVQKVGGRFLLDRFASNRGKRP